jgi:hypothetical protein
MAATIMKEQTRKNLEVNSLVQPSDKVQTILDMADLIETSITTFMASPDRRSEDDLKALLQGIQAETLNVRSLSKALVASGCLGEFVKFPKLPPEIRQQIWKHALEGLRIVEFSATSRAF